MPILADRLRVFRFLALFAALGAYLTMVLGGYVSSTGAGLACPDWPLCNGALVPDLSRADVAIEWTHRLVAGLTGLLLIAAMAAAWLWLRKERPLVLLATTSVMLLLGQVTLGMLTIASRLDPLVVTLHLAMATATFALSLILTVVAWWPGAKANPEPTGA